MKWEGDYHRYTDRFNSEFSLMSNTLYRQLWWKLMPGFEIIVPWPKGWTELDHLGTQISSNDPNDHYRPWLEKHVGRQHLDWDWKMREVRVVEGDQLIIKFRIGKKDQMIQAALRWG